MKALLVSDVTEEYRHYQTELKQQLLPEGYTYFINMSVDENLPDYLDKAQPELVIIMLDSPDAHLLETLRTIDRKSPVPIILLAKYSDHATTTAAIMSGVSAYIVGDLALKRMKTVLGVALARFQVRHHFKAELASYKIRLDDRRDVDKAKGILMEHSKISEDEAYQMLRKMAMDQNIRIGEAARNTLKVLSILG